MGWNEDLQNERIEMFEVIGEFEYDIADDELYDSGWNEVYDLDDDDQFTDYESDFDLSDQEYDDWADRDAHMTYDGDQDDFDRF